MSHKEEALSIGRQSVEEKWSAEQTMRAINGLMLDYSYDLSPEIQSALAQGIMEAARNQRITQSNDKT